MTVNLDELFIPQESLESLVDGNIITNISIDIYRGFILKNSRKIISVLMTGFFVFIVVLILVLPLTLILMKSSGSIPQEINEINQLLVILLGVCLGLMLLINIYLWQQSQKIKSLAILVDKTEQYNHLIQAISVVKHLESVNPPNNQDWESQHQELMDALRVIKNSLTQAFTVERIIRKHEGMINNQYELLTNIETNLTALMTFDLSHSSSNYRELLQDAIQIGMTVHREVRKLRNERK